MRRPWLAVLSQLPVTVAAVAASFGVRLALTAWIGPGLPTFVTFYPAVMAVALLAGFWSGLLATALTALVVDYWILPPVGHFTIASPVDRLGLVIFTCMGLFMSTVAELLRRNLEKAAANAREAALSESRARLATFAEATFEGIVESEAGQILDCNTQFARMLGYTVAELRGMEIAALVAPEDRARVAANILPDRDSVIEHNALRKDGARIMVEAHGRPVSPGSARRHTALRDITARRQAEEALRESRREADLLAHLLELSSQPFAIGYPDGRLGRINSAFEQLTGYTAAELRALDWSIALTPPEWRDPERQMLDELNRTGRPVRYEKEYIRKDGSRVPLELLVHLQRDVEGKPVYYYSFLTDITARKHAEEALHQRAEEALRLSEQEFRFLAEAVPQIVWATRPDGWNIFFNQRWVDYTGMTMEESSGHGWNTPFHPEDKSRAWEAWQRATQFNERYSLECRLRRADGVYRWWLIRGEPMRGPSGEILKWFGTCTDIEDLKYAEAKLQEANALLEQRVTERTATLREKEQLLQDVMDGCPSPIFLKDLDGRFITINRVLEKQLGLSREQIKGKTDYDIAPKELADCWHANDRKVMAVGKALQIEEEADLPAGHHTFLASKFPLTNASGQMYGIGSISHDITDRKQAEEKIQELSRRLSYHVDHSPLAVIEWGPDMRIVRWSGAAEHIFGWTAAEVLGKRMEDFRWIYHEDTAQVAEVSAELQTGADTHRFSANRNFRKDGTVAHCEWYNSSLVDASGRLHSILSLVLDVTARKQAEEALRESAEIARQRAEELARLMDSAPIAIRITHDLACRVITGNQRAYQFFAVEPGQDLTARFFKDGRELPLAEQPIQVAMAQGMDVRNNEMDVLLTDGRMRTAMTSASPLRDAAGRVRGCIATYVDITERKAAELALQTAQSELEARVKERTAQLSTTIEKMRQVEKQLQQSQQDLRGLTTSLLLTEERERKQLAMVLHDSIGQMVALMRIKLSALEQRLQATDCALEAAALKKLADDTIRQVRSLTTELSPPILYQMGLAAALQDAGAQLQREFGAQFHFEGVDFLETLDETLRTLLYQSGRELLVNIGKHARAKHVHLTITIQDDNLKLIVLDDGVGFKPDVAAAKARKVKSFGFFSIRERMFHVGGSMDIVSAPGKGTTVTLTVPLKLSTNEERQGQDGHSNSVGG